MRRSRTGAAPVRAARLSAGSVYTCGKLGK
jgi:hypothetical protein